MNQFTAREHAAAILLRAKAEHLVCTYAEPQDLAAARLAVLMIAAQQEAQAQGFKSRVVLSILEEE